MNNIQLRIGSKIRMYRKANKMTLDDLSSKVFKSKSILSKYELGEACIDVVTLYEIAAALQVDVRQLLDDETVTTPADTAARFGLFRSSSLYLYMSVKQKKQQILRGYLTLNSDSSEHTNVTFYMDIPDFSQFYKCAVIYHGDLICHPTNAIIRLVSHSDPSDHTTIYAGLHMNSPSACYAMLIQSGYTTGDPGAFKTILSSSPLPETGALEEYLKITKEDLNYIRQKNIFAYRSDIIDNSRFFN